MQVERHAALTGAEGEDTSSEKELRVKETHLECIRYTQEKLEERDLLKEVEEVVAYTDQQHKAGMEIEEEGDSIPSKETAGEVCFHPSHRSASSSIEKRKT